MIFSFFFRTLPWILGIWVSLGLGLPLVHAEDQRRTWPQWRGPNRDGHISGPDWPGTLQGDSLKKMWRVDLGPGYSGPIVAEDRVFVTETKDKTYEIIRALDRNTGKEIWQAQWRGAITVPPYARVHGDWIRSTPAFDGESLYVAGMRDVLVCLDPRTGAERWRVDFVERFRAPVPVFGFVCSPLVDGEAVYVQAAGAVVKLSKKTGKVLWRSFPDEGGPNGSAVSSPVLAEVAGKTQLLVQNRRKLAGLDPSSGKVLWSEEIPAFNSMNILTPVAYQDGVFTSAHGGRSFLFTISQENERVVAKKSWSHKAQGFMSTPVVINGYLYLLLRSQRFCCLELKTGRECWTSSKSFGQYWSMVVQGDRILALDQRGILYLIRANPEKFVLLDSRKITDADTWAHLAVSGDQLFVRELQAIVAFRWNQHVKNADKRKSNNRKD